MTHSTVRAALLLTLAFVATATHAQSYSQGGYADKHSVAVGETISFHIATSSNPFNVQIINLASPNTVIQTITGLSSQARDCTGLWENGCGWPVTTTFTVPTVYVPGYYAARFPTSSGNRHILFVVKAAVLGSYAPIAIIQPSNSDVAYNRWGGKSVYDTISDDGHRAHVVSFNRPYYDNTGFARFGIWEERFVAWMKAENRKFEVITDDEMEAGVSLAGYKAVLIVGHSEYWSLNARQHLEAYSRSGGHIAVFGANTMWWQVRVNLQTRQMTVYKDATLDPLTGVDDDVVTTNWTDWPVLNPENTILGASFLNAAYVNKLNSYERLPLEERTPYTVRKADHWAFAGTGLTDGAEMGRSVGAIEVDGALFNTLPNGQVVVEGSDGTPLSYEVLATLPASDGYATIGFYANEQGGGVFNGAARDWSYGLADDTVVQQITRNVLDRLSTGDPFEYNPRSTPNRAEDLFNTPPAAPDFLPGWRYHKFGFTIAPRCAHEGPSGLEVTGPRWTNVVRNLPVGRDGLTKGAAGIWINADLIQSTVTFGVPLVAFIDYKGPTLTKVAGLEFMKRAAGPAVRVSSYDGSGSSVARTDWVILTPGWHSVQFAWESGGLLQLNVSGQKVSTPNPVSGQHMNALMLEFAGSGANGSVCVDQLQFRNAFAPASAATSTVTASPATIVADGTSTANVVVKLVDADGNAILNGGDQVTMSTTLGSLSTVTDAGDGTYTAVLTSATSSGTATISAVVNGQPVTDTATVTFTSAGPSSFSLTSASTAMAGQPVTLVLEVKDGDGEIAAGYRGTVDFTSNPAGGTLPADYTFTEADAGRHEFTATAPTNVGTWTVTVADPANPQLTDSFAIEIQGETTTTLTSAPNPSYAGETVTFTASITSSAGGSITGSVTFRAGNADLGTVNVSNGVAKLDVSSLPEGTHSITAEYSGGGGFLGSTSSSISHVVRAAQFGAPQGLTAVATSPSSVRVTWQLVEGAAGYEVFRRGSNGAYEFAGTTNGTTFTDTDVTPDSAYVYYVRAVRGAGAPSANSAIDPAVTIMFTDDPIVRRRTVIQAVHVMELRTAVNALRETAGLPEVSFTDPSLVGRPFRPEHVLQLREALAAARTALGLPPAVYSGPAPASGAPVRAAHVQQLRDALK